MELPDAAVLARLRAKATLRAPARGLRIREDHGTRRFGIESASYFFQEGRFIVCSGRSNKYRFAIVVLVLLVVGIPSYLLTCTLRPARTDGVPKQQFSYTINVLSALAIAIRDVDLDTEEDPLQEMSVSSRRWLESHGIVDEEGRVRDGWGRPVVIETRDDGAIVIGSSGPNGIWEHGGGDDIVIILASDTEERELKFGPLWPEVVE